MLSPASAKIQCEPQALNAAAGSGVHRVCAVFLDTDLLGPAAKGGKGVWGGRGRGRGSLLPRQPLHLPLPSLLAFLSLAARCRCVAPPEGGFHFLKFVRFTNDPLAFLSNAPLLLPSCAKAPASSTVFPGVTQPSLPSPRDFSIRGSLLPSGGHCL